MGDKKLIYADDARRAILETDPKLAYCIERIKGVDAVEVVRCKDCKHRIDDIDFVCGHFCTKRPSAGGHYCEDNDFCSYGERKDNV